MKCLIWALALGVVLVARVADAAVLAERHMIVAAEPDAAEAGLAMLRRGGSAVDAAIAAQLVLTLVEPQSSGIGGGAYMLVSDAPDLFAYDGCEMAPASAHPRMFLDADGGVRRGREIFSGGLPVGVPGTIAMLAMAHREHGRLPWAQLFEPAIALAENGFTVPARLAAALARAQRIRTMPGMRANFFHADGTPVGVGEVLRNPDLAETFRRIAVGGPEAFYRGLAADQIVTAISEGPVNPVSFTHDDLANYRPLEKTPLCGIYRAYRVCSLPPSTSGGTTVLQILGLLAHFPSDRLQPGTLSAVHLVSEASRLAYADRDRWLGDPAFVDPPVAGLLSDSYLDGRAQLIDPEYSLGLAESGTPPMRRQGILFTPQREQVSHGTSHLSAVDETGMVVSMTMSIQAAFGAAIMAGGFILNNELTDFSLEPMIGGRPVANAAAAGKRPLSSMSPVIIFAPGGEFFAALGSPGGRLIIAYVVQALVGLIDGQLSMEETAAVPRHVNLNGATRIEDGTMLVDLAPALAAMGHDVRIGDFDSGLNGIVRMGEFYEGGADPRREGVALGD